MAPGQVLTAAAVVAACPTLRIGTDTARVLRSDGGLALLEARGLPAPHRPGAPAKAASEDRVVVEADAAGVSVAPGLASGESRVTAPLQPGAAGAPVLDRTGALAGIVAAYPPAPRLVAGVMPPTGFPVVPGAAIVAFLAGAGIALTPPPGGSIGAAASAVGAAVVGLGCLR